MLTNKHISCLATKFLSFGTVGVIGTAAHDATLIMLVDLAGATPVLSSGIGALVGALVNYRLNYSFTFRSDKRHRDVIVRFLTVAAIGLSLNVSLMSILADRLHLHYLLSQVTATLLVLVWNFTGNLLWSFRPKRALP